MFKKFKAAIAAVVTGAAGLFGGIQLEAAKIEAKWDAYRTAHYAAFNPACSYKRAGVSDASYVRAWDRKATYDITVAAFAFNHGITQEQAQDCFIKPVK
jgi:hypothetical protein